MPRIKVDVGYGGPVVVENTAYSTVENAVFDEWYSPPPPKLRRTLWSCSWSAQIEILEGGEVVIRFGSPDVNVSVEWRQARCRERLE